MAKKTALPLRKVYQVIEPGPVVMVSPTLPLKAELRNDFHYYLLTRSHD